MPSNPYSTNPYKFNPYSASPQPVYPTYDVPGQDQGGGSGWDWLWDKAKALPWGQILQTGGDIAGGIIQANLQGDALRQQKEQFDKTYGLSQNTQALQASNQLNRAPLWDQATYMAKQYTPPMPFSPRDFTKGQHPGQTVPQGGAAQQLQALREASAKYKQGDGGIDTSTMRLVLSRLGMPVANTDDGVDPNRPYTQLALGKAQNDPSGNPQGVSITNPPHMQNGGGNDFQSRVNAAQYPPGFFPQGLPESATEALMQQEWSRIFPGEKMPPTPVLQAFWRNYRDAYNRRTGGV